MNSRLAFVLGFLLMAGLAIATADEYKEYEEEAPNDEEQTQEDMKTENALVEKYNSPKDNNKGLCHLGIGIWNKPGSFIKCNCMKCVCNVGGKWACGFEFSYCPYYYCGNQIYNPKKHICCCGKLHLKKSRFRCCGYHYYSSLTSKCCAFFSVKSKKSICPRSKI